MVHADNKTILTTMSYLALLNLLAIAEVMFYSRKFLFKLVTVVCFLTLVDTKSGGK